MALIGKNIWLAFYFTAIFWTLFLGGASYVTYQTVYQEFVHDQKSLTLIKSTSLNSSFNQYETILKIVAEDLLRNDTYNNDQAATEVLTSAVDLDPSIVALVTYNAMGERMSSAPYFSTPKGFSLLKLKESQTTFQKALNSNNVILGRTYFSNLVNTIILPFRKSVRDENGNVLFVLALSINMEQGFDYFLNDYKEDKYRDIYLFRESDHYFQLAPINKVRDKEAYLELPSEEFVHQAISRSIENTGVSYDDIKQSGEVFVNAIEHRNYKSLTAFIFLDEYKLWLVSEINIRVIYDNFWKKFSLFIIAYFFSLMIMFVLFRKIAKNQNKEKDALFYQVNRDFLTNLYNRYYLEQYLKKVEPNTSFSLIFIDIDNFKSVNDNFGHGVGDKVLKEIATRLQSLFCNSELLVRSGTDEYVFVFLGNNQERASEICDQIMTTIQQPILSNQYNIVLSASMSVCFYPTDGSDSTLLKRNADLAMYESKKEKNTVTFFDQKLLDEYLHKNDIELELKKALTLGEMHLVYQPQYCRARKLKGVEALLRWENAKLGMIPPDIFIPIAESIGYMNEIGEFVMITAMKEMKALQNEIGIEFDLSINVSVKQFQKSNFFETLMNYIQQQEYNANGLLLEVTENVLIDDIEDMRSLMQKLRKSDIRISLDDFGTGYSSLSLLKSLPIDELKIDRSFIIDLLYEVNSHSMVSGVIALAKNLNMTTVVEGVETKEVEDVLRELECDVYQGYYYSKPQSVSELKKFLLNQ